MRPEERVLSAFVGLLRRMPAATEDDGAAIRAVASGIGSLLPALAHGFLAVRDQGRTVEVVSPFAPGGGLPPPGTRVPWTPGLEGSAPDSAGRRRDPRELPAALASACLAARCGAVHVLPVRLGGETLGVWLAGTRDAAGLPEEDLRLLRGVADGIALLLDRARVERECLSRARALAESDKLAAIGRLVAGVAHELGGPLQAVISLSEVLARDPDRGDRVESAHRILRSALRCRSMVQDLLAYARKQPHRLTPVRVEDALMDALELDRFSDVGEIQIHIDGPPALPPVLADGQRLCQVILNLITNARQATAATGKPGLVRVTLEAVSAAESRIPGAPSGKVVRLAVSDRGPGIPPEVRETLFDPFVTTKPEGQGTGLGLSVSRGIVEELGGRLDLDPAHAPGARFLIELPALAESATSETATAGDAGPATTGRSILLVDDDREVLDTYEVILALSDHRVRSCDRARKALQVLQEESFDAIVCDIRLPDLDGREFLEEVRRLRPGLASRVIFATGDIVNDDTREFLRQVPNPALIKPFQIEDLERAIASVVR